MKSDGPFAMVGACRIAPGFCF